MTLWNHVSTNYPTTYLILVRRGMFRHCPKSHCDEGGYLIVNIVNNPTQLCKSFTSFNQIHVRYVDNTTTLYCLRCPNGHPLDHTQYMC